MKKKKESDEVAHPGFYRGCEVQLSIGNFDANIKTNLGQSPEDIALLCWHLYISARELDARNIDPGVR